MKSSQEKQQKSVIIGHAVFSPQMSRGVQARLISKPVKNILLRTTWQLSNQKYKKQKWNQIFQIMLQSYCSQILFCNDKTKQPILKQIEHVKFSNLKFIWMTHLDATNIQLLPSVFTSPQMSFLMLSMNKIKSVKSLNKTNFPKLSTFSLGDNLYHQYSVQRMNLADKMQYFELDCWQFLQLVTKYDISFMVKLKPYSIHTIQLDKKYQFRIRQDKVWSKLYDKYRHNNK